MIKKFTELFFNEELDVKEKMFRFVILIGTIVAVIGMLETVMYIDIEEILVPLGILVMTLMIVVVASFKYHKIDVLASILGVVLICIIFPGMFILSGGISGGAPAWFVLALFYTFMMFEGKRLVFFIILSLASVAVTYIIGYTRPEIIMEIGSPLMVYIDSAMGIVLVGVSGGLFLKFHKSIYEAEKEITRKQKEELEELSSNRNNLFTTMSHELRAPINTIVGLDEMILRKEENEELREYASNIKTTSNLLLSLVNDILDLSKMEMQKMVIVPGPYDTAALFRELVDIIQIPAQEKGLKLIVDIDKNMPAQLMGDEKRIKQVIINILTNAVKYTDEGSVTFTAESERIDDNLVRLKIQVTDTGIGIKKENIKNLYDMFKRIDLEHNNKIQGSGLGLAITKQLVDLMGGEIKVDSIYTKGTIFTILLAQTVLDKKAMGEIEYVEVDKAEEYYKHMFEAPDARVLVVDDNEMNIKVVKSLLEDTKLQIDSALSGEECLVKTMEKYYDIILLDYMMPRMNGKDTLKAIRLQENGLCHDSQILALSASNNLEVDMANEKYVFDGYLDKPIIPAKLESALLGSLPPEIVEYRRVKETSAIATGNTADVPMPGKRKKKIYITTDCICDIPDKILQTLDIKMMYLYVKTPKGRFADTREIDSDNLSSEMSSSNFVVQADSVSVEEQQEFFAQALTEAEDVVHISLASGLGKSYSVAVTAAQSFDHVHVVDCGHISCGQGLLVMYAADLAKRGFKIEEIINAINGMKHKIHSYFMISSLDALCRNGYMKKSEMILCHIFGIRPELTLKQSRFKLKRLYAGNIERLWKKFIKHELSEKKKINNDIIFITYAGLNVKQREFIKNEISKYVKFKKVIMQKASVSCACNAGVPTIGISFYEE